MPPDNPTMATRILVIEDDFGLRRLLRDGLGGGGYAVEIVGTGHDALAAAEARPPELLVIDIGLPDSDGRDVCQALRARGAQAPVLFLTARDAVPDRLSGFAAGGDDYLTKPFAFAELVARVRALVRRGGAELAIEVGSMRLDPAAHAVASGR